jgi:alanine dehydrogenase
MQPIFVTFLSGLDVARLALTDEEILSSVEAALGAQGRGESVIEPRVHLIPGVAVEGHFNVLRGYVGAPVDLAGVKVIGDFLENYRHDLPSELGVLALFDPRTGMPRAIMDASAITDMRTGAVTAVGAKYLARPLSRVLAHIGARGTSYWNVRLLSRLFDFDEIRIHSRRAESREALAARLRSELDAPVRAVSSWEEAIVGADIVVEASRLAAPEPLLKTAWIKHGALVVPYGTMSAVELSLTDIMSKVVVDDWGQCKAGRFGALRAHVDSGKLSEQTLYAELGSIVAQGKPGRERDDETILLWHRGLSSTDIALGHALIEKARRNGIGQELRFA